MRTASSKATRNAGSVSAEPSAKEFMGGTECLASRENGGWHRLGGENGGWHRLGGTGWVAAAVGWQHRVRGESCAKTVGGTGWGGLALVGGVRALREVRLVPEVDLPG